MRLEALRKVGTIAKNVGLLLFVVSGVAVVVWILAFAMVVKGEEKRK